MALATGIRVALLTGMTGSAIMEYSKNVDDVKYNGNMLLITYKKGKNNLVEIMECLKEDRIKYNKIFSERPTLNDVFLELTGKELRD